LFPHLDSGERDMPSTFLAGYDGSAESHAAVDLAVRLAEPTGTRVVAAHVYPHSTATYWIGVEAMPYDEELETDLRRQAEEVVEGVDIAGVSRQVVKADSAARGLHDLAQTTGAELISVGATHHGPLGRLAPGSVGMHLLHGAPCPVVVSPSDVEGRPLRRIGVAYDDRDESKAAFAVADRLAKQLNAELLVLGSSQPLVVPVGAPPVVPIAMARVEEAQRAFRETLERAAAGAQVRAEARSMVGPTARTLADASGDVDLLVTGSRGYGAIRGVVLGSVSRYLVDHAACPVVVVPRPS
jgi:nucleotide-binding universal stress UspA family protein